MLLTCFVFFCLASVSNAAITDDFNCTEYKTAPTAGFFYTERAVNCIDELGSATCNSLFQTVPATPVIITAGTDVVRPIKCYSRTAAPATYDSSLYNMARTQCAKTCGYCCTSPAFNCDNVRFPRLNCATITPSQCRDATWRQIIATDCPAACGFCLLGGCIDAVVECANDKSICNAVGMQDFVNTNCRQTCGRCSATNTGTNTGTDTCATYTADSSSACAAWAANGFCTNTFYTLAQRKARCGTTCRIC